MFCLLEIGDFSAWVLYLLSLFIHLSLSLSTRCSPLLAAANALLLKKTISLPSECIRSGVASIDDVVNILAEKALLSSSKVGGEVHLDELLNIIPKLQFGMDVNPQFTQGVTGVEYTNNLTAFDLLHSGPSSWMVVGSTRYSNQYTGGKQDV